MLNVDQDTLSLNSKLYCTLKGKEVFKFTLQNENIRLDITNLGCCITAIYTPDRDGLQNNIVAGFENMKDYENNRDYFGCVLGRYASRIAGGRFFLNGKEIVLSVNDGANHLHGGVDGFFLCCRAVCPHRGDGAALFRSPASKCRLPGSSSHADAPAVRAGCRAAADPRH